MTAREQKGQEIARTRKIHRKGDAWLVPSQSGKGAYLVRLDAEEPNCTCPDFELRHVRCKHIIAASLTLERSLKTETDSKGQTTVTETMKVTKKVTYAQDWPAYNAAQTEEKSTFQLLLHNLCQTISEPDQKMGRPRFPLSDMVFSAAFKVYSTVSGRRFMIDLQEAQGKGYLTRLPHYNSIFRYLERPALTPIIRDLIVQNSLPLKAVETDFAVDASGFSTCQTVTWFNARYGHEQDNHDWIKAHLMCGVKTNVVTSIEITGRFAHDAPVFPQLVEATAEHFTLREVSADKAYSSRKNLDLVDAKGGTPYIPFKTGTRELGNDIWLKMWHLYSLNRDAFMEHYHKRSNVESAFSMIKRKFGDYIRSKTQPAQINEVLCKVLCHNICVVIQSMHELDISPTFGAELTTASKVA